MTIENVNKLENFNEISYHKLTSYSETSKYSYFSIANKTENSNYVDFIFTNSKNNIINFASKDCKAVENNENKLRCILT